MATRILDTSDSFSFSDHSGKPCKATFDDSIVEQEIMDQYGLDQSLPYEYREKIPITNKKYKRKGVAVYGTDYNRNRKENKRKRNDDMLLKEIRGY